jgi:hypothetical protein
MPTLDVTHVLANPAFSGSLSVTRNAQTVGTNGLAVNTPTVISFAGVAFPKRAATLRRDSEGARITGSIQIVTTFALVDGRTGADADVVTYNGRRYTVAEIEDYSTYGAGFIIATCDLLPLSGG